MNLDFDNCDFVAVGGGRMMSGLRSATRLRHHSDMSQGWSVSAFPQFGISAQNSRTVETAQPIPNQSCKLLAILKKSSKIQQIGGDVWVGGQSRDIDWAKIAGTWQGAESPDSSE